MSYNDIISRIIVLFIILFVGYLIRKINVIDDDGSKIIATLVVKLTGPLLILNSVIQRPKLPFSEIKAIVIIAILVYMFLFVMTLTIPKILKAPEEDIGVYKFMIMFSNVGFMGYPVISTVFGIEAVFYAAIFNLPFYFLVYSLGIYFVSQKKEREKKDMYKDFLNPGLCALFFGVLIMVLDIRFPIVINESVGIIGGLTTPLSMIGIGTSFAKVNIKNLYSNIILYIYSVLKLIIFPLMVLLILKNLGYTGIMLGVPVIITGMPVAANAVMLSKEYDGNDILAAEGVFISTLLSIITIPILLYFLTN